MILVKHKHSKKNALIEENKAHKVTILDKTSIIIIIIAIYYAKHYQMSDQQLLQIIVMPCLIDKLLRTWKNKENALKANVREH